MAGSSWRTIVTKRVDTCRLCDGEIEAGAKARWHPSKGMEHLNRECSGEIKPEFAEAKGNVEPTSPEVPQTEAEVQTVLLESGERQMKSQFRSKCRICTKPIERGAAIAWRKDLGARHIGCQEGEGS